MSNSWTPQSGYESLCKNNKTLRKEVEEGRMDPNDKVISRKFLGNMGGDLNDSLRGFGPTSQKFLWTLASGVSFIEDDNPTRITEINYPTS